MKMTIATDHSTEISAEISWRSYDKVLPIAHVRYTVNYLYITVIQVIQVILYQQYSYSTTYNV